jgi:hypothetical protein
MHSPYSYIPLTRVDQQISHENEFAISSPILFDLLENLSTEEHHEILDLLPAKQGVIDLFSSFSCKLYLPGCMQQLCEMSSDRYDTVTKLNRAFTKNIGIYKKQKAALNLIFLWDLPNYLDKAVMKGLIEYLLQHARQKVKLHLYIHTREYMPSSPGVYSIMPEGKIWLENSSDTTVKSPLYFQEALQTLFHPFRVKRSIMLSSGLQEYILEL